MADHGRSRPGHSRSKLTSPSPTYPPASVLHGSTRLMGAGDLRMEIAAACVSLSVQEACLWPCPCLCSPAQSFQTGVPRASENLLSLLPQQAEVSQCYKKEGS